MEIIEKNAICGEVKRRRYEMAYKGFSFVVAHDNGQPITDSLTVAKAFGKRHRYVLRDIETLECSEKFTGLKIEPSDYKDSTGRTNKK